MIIEVSLIVIAVCQVVFLITMVLIALNIRGSFQNINQSVSRIEGHANTALTNVNDIIVKVKDNVAKTDPLFDSISKIGLIMESYISNISPHSKTARIFSVQPKKGSDVADWAEWVSLGLLLWQKFKRKD